MSIAQAETLKRDLTDKFVVVRKGVAELRRFDGLTGQVKTVNMNGQVLVQFDGPVDISWYDIHPSYLQVVDAPLPKSKAPEAKAKAEPAEKAAAKPKAAAPAGEKKLSPLEQARLQGASGAPGAKKPSPLDQARKQGAPKAAPVAEPESVAEAPVAKAVAAAPAAKPAGGAALTKPGSTAEIIALCRQQGAVKK